MAQRALPGTGAVEGVVDAAYPDCRLILEADGRRWHTRVDDLRRDHERDAEAARAGWQTLRFLYEQITQGSRGRVRAWWPTSGRCGPATTASGIALGGRGVRRVA